MKHINNPTKNLLVRDFISLIKFLIDFYFILLWWRSEKITTKISLFRFTLCIWFKLPIINFTFRQIIKILYIRPISVITFRFDIGILICMPYRLLKSFSFYTLNNFNYLIIIWIIYLLEWLYFYYILILILFNCRSWRRMCSILFILHENIINVLMFICFLKVWYFGLTWMIIVISHLFMLLLSLIIFF